MSISFLFLLPEAFILSSKSDKAKQRQLLTLELEKAKTRFTTARNKMLATNMSFADTGSFMLRIHLWGNSLLADNQIREMLSPESVEKLESNRCVCTPT